MNTTHIGLIAEDQTAVYLQLRGYRILGRNWKTKYCEIDIVASRYNVVYFVEVKYRSILSAGDGFAYITTSKLRHMQRAAQIWTLTNHWHGEIVLAAAAVTGSSADCIEIIEL